MAGLRVFVSSTCYDLSILRSQLRLFIQGLGYEPIMSDYDDVLYDPRVHTHTSCVDEVGNCDVLVVIIGSRFGGKANIEALERINFEQLKKDDRKVEELKAEGNISVTQLEVIKAIENGMPVYTFIDKRVWHDHSLYEKNKSSEIIDKIVFPSIEKQETAQYIFEFINFVRLRTRGNNIFTFEKVQDIEETLKKQWSSYFQRLLYEQRFVQDERKKMEILSDQFEDLKTAILSSIDNVDQREVARGIVRFRRLFDFILGFRRLDVTYYKTTKDTWDVMLTKVGIKRIIDSLEIEAARTRPGTYLLCEDETFYISRYSKDGIEELAREWNAYVSMKDKSKEIIIDTLSETYRGTAAIRHIGQSFIDYINGQKNIRPVKITYELNEVTSIESKDDE